MKLKRQSIILLAALILVTIAGCANTDTPSSEPPSSPSAPVQSETPSESLPAQESAAYIFTDSAGREVELPRDIERIAPSGPLAQIVLFTLCPDKLVGFASDLDEEQFEFIDKKYMSLPVFGNFYADTLNLESVLTADPQVVIDIGEPKLGIEDDMAGIQDKTGIPTVFIQMEMDSMASAYETLGELTGETEQARKMIEYIEKTFTETEQKLASIPEAERLRVYYGQDDGLSAVIKGTVHADVIDAAGGINVAEVEESVRGGASIISMEQLMLWNPDVVILAPGSIYDDIDTRAEWEEISAVKTGNYYEIPNGPYNWMGRPPSVNRLIGIKWLSNLLYPDVFDYDMAEETKEFYQLFYHCDVTDAQIEALLAKSTFK